MYSYLGINIPENRYWKPFSKKTFYKVLQNSQEGFATDAILVTALNVDNIEHIFCDFFENLGTSIFKDSSDCSFWHMIEVLLPVAIYRKFWKLQSSAYGGEKQKK